jgi:hypothetical protein|tara:strand:+ start:275 stop:484 length:210 start_codon:yes stop_codon:yes gene_type:complete
MKKSGQVKSGDLVVSVYDEQRGLKCIGIVLEIKKDQARVMWSSESSPIGWWREQQLRVISNVPEKGIKK